MVLTLDDYNKDKFTFVGYNPINSKKEIVNCYNVLNDLCTLGNVQKMYIPPLLDKTKSFKENQVLNEISLVNKLNIDKDSRLLELGCGCGRISQLISSNFDCNVYGINIDNKQIENARKFKLKKGNKKTNFIHGDFNNPLQFENNYFDGIYAVQPLTYCNDLLKNFKEFFRVLKPGKRIIIQDLTLLDNFDKNNKEHIEKTFKARLVMEAGGMWHYKFWNNCATQAGFNIISSNPAETPYNLDIPDLPLLKSEHKNYDKINKFIKFLEKLRIIPNYVSKLIERLREGADELIEMEEQKLLTMSWNLLLEKPLN